MGRLILYGDSHARQYAPVMERFSNDNDMDFELVAGPACISLPNLTNYYHGKTSQKCIGQWKRLYERRSKDDVIMIAHRWGPLLSDVNGNAIGKIGESDAASLAMIRSLGDLIGQYDSKQRFIIVGNVPAAAPASAEMQRGPARCKQYVNGDCPTGFARKDGELFAFNQVLRETLKLYPNVTFIDPYDSFCDDDKCYVRRGSDIYYSDDAHLTVSGAETFLEHEQGAILSRLTER